MVEWWWQSSADWFAHRPAFDRAFRTGFLPLHAQAVAGDLDHWITTATGGLALMLLLDQFPRNAFRGTARMYASDAQARVFARQAEAQGHMAGVRPELRLFFALPFSHSEALPDQELAVELNRRLGQPWLSHAEGHRDIIRRFGRFPHRNAILGRKSTPEEDRFLQSGGFRG